MKLLLDMNLSPGWVNYLTKAGFEAIHWSSVGPPRASDTTILSWAKQNDCVLFTHDLDFGTLLAASGAHGPSVIQLRTQDTLPDVAGAALLAALRQFATPLELGALIVVDVARSRARLLPIEETNFDSAP